MSRFDGFNPGKKRWRFQCPFSRFAVGLSQAKRKRGAVVKASRFNFLKFFVLEFKTPRTKWCGVS